MDASGAPAEFLPARERSPAPFLILFAMPLLTAWFASRGDLSWVALWAITLVALPLVDSIVPQDRWNPAPDAPLREGKRSAFTWIVMAYVPVQLAVTAYVLWVASTQDLAWYNRLGLAATLGLSNGAIGFTLGHELIHRVSRTEFLFGKLLLWGMAYGHYAVEHARGHHRYVGTPRDPAFAKFNQSFHAFFPRSVIGQLISAWTIEGERLAKLGTPALSYKNEIFRALAIEIVLLGLLTWWLGWLGLGLFFVQLYVAVSLLEAANYAQHYGLARREISPGKFEPQTHRHSWSTYHRVTNWYTIELGRHADHHGQPGRMYQMLRTQSDGPVLPASYGAMITVAMIPPLWFRIMNPRVEAWRASAPPPAPEPALPEAGAAA